MKTTYRLCLSVLCMIAYLICYPAAGGTNDVPKSLEDWKGWVLKGYETDLCPCYYDKPQPTVCAWPAELYLNLNDTGGTFSQSWTIYKESLVPLPGGSSAWPRQVTAAGQEAIVVSSADGRPAVRLMPGTHDIQGGFLWGELPETMRIPKICGLVSLKINSKPVDQVYLDRENRLYVRKKDQQGRARDSIDIKVYRLLNDQIPMTMTTLLKMNVSGKSRDMALKNILQPGFLPLSITSQLPVKVNEQGGLSVRISAGHWEISVVSRSLENVDQIGLETAPYGSETWSFISQNHLRMVRLKGLSAVDPSQTDLPEPWKKYPSFIANQGDQLTFELIKRGNPDPPPNTLNLQRTLWLDFDGNGWTAKDTIKGVRNREGVFTMNPPFALGRVTVDGQDRLITEHGPQKMAGIELLKKRVDLVAESRIENKYSRFPATGWNMDFQSAKAVLNLPVGYGLFTVKGVDRASGTWLGRWTLLDFFITLIIAIVIYKLWGILPGLLGLVTLGICFHETGSPGYIWISILSSVALLKALPDNRFRKMVALWYLVSAVILISLAVPFMVRQARVATYPQLEKHVYQASRNWMNVKQKQAVSMPQEYDMAESEEMAVQMEPPQAPVPAKQKRVKSITGGSAGRYQQKPTDPGKRMRWIDPDALNQTGPGLPFWKWKTHNLSWNGPVKSVETIQVYLMPPWMNRILGYLRVILTALLLMVVIDVRALMRKNYQQYLPMALGFIMISGCFLAIRPAAADGFPPQHLLDELRQHLIEKPMCLPRCAQVPVMHLSADGKTLGFEYDIHSDARIAAPLPQVGNGHYPLKIKINDQPVAGLYRGEGNIRYVLLERGIHHLSVQSYIGNDEETNVSFDLVPTQLHFQSADWTIQGRDTEGRVKSGVRLTRRVEGADSPSDIKKKLRSRFDDFFILERHISLGMEWRVSNRLKRISDTGTSAVMQVPLLAGESIMTGDFETRDNRIQVSMDADQSQVVWESALKKQEKLQLTATRSREYMEKWFLKSSPIWHVDFKGIPVIHSLDNRGEYSPQWQPWPGEALSLDIHRPVAVKGNILTIDRCRLAVAPGKRSAKATLDLRIRSSKGGQHTLSIPADATLQQVKVNQKELPVNAKDGHVTLPLDPGLQLVRIHWTQPVVSPLLTRIPDVRLNHPAVNIDVEIQMPRNRWILWTTGPMMGPAVLFWTYLIVIVMVSIILGRVKLTPLAWWAWLLLGLGLTQIPIIISGVIVTWFFAFGLRGKDKLPQGPAMFNLMQVTLTFLTCLAMAGLFAAISTGLLGVPDMQISGNGSSARHLYWTIDRLEGVRGQLGGIQVISLNIFVFKLLMLTWSLWLAYSLVRWLKWAWQAFSYNGLWRKVPRKIKSPRSGFWSSKRSAKDEASSEEESGAGPIEPPPLKE